MLELYFDGCGQPLYSRRVYTYGFVVYLDGERIGSDNGFAGAGYKTDISQAEAMGLIKGLEWVRDSDIEGEYILIKGDNKEVINQLLGKYKRRKDFIPKILDLLIGMNWDAKWIHRSKNKEADKEAFIAYKTYISQHGKA